MDSFEKLISQPHVEGGRRLHYVPSFYLAGFAHKNHLAVFDRKAGTVKLQTPEHTARIRQLYTFEDKQGRRRFDLEKMFSYHDDRAAHSSLDKPIT